MGKGFEEREMEGFGGSGYGKRDKFKTRKIYSTEGLYLSFLH